jgi:AAA family ATP:ADP antiporter
MGIAANIALVISGSFVKYVCKATATSLHPTHTMLSVLLATVVAASVVMMGIKAAIDKWLIAPYCSIQIGSNSEKKEKKKKEKKGFIESLQALTASPRIASLATLVMSYGIAHRLFEFAWKHQVRVLYDTPAGYQGILADVSIATGYSTLGLMLLGRFVFQIFGWTAAAAVTPVFMAGAGAVFFIFSIAAQQGVSILSMDPAAMAFAGVMSGCVCQIVARSAKFSLFDSSKEMVWIEMDREEKSKGKAAVDLLGSQVGKSGGAWVTQLALIFSGSIGAALPVIATVYLGVCTAWLGAVGTLGALVRKHEEEKAEAAAEQARSREQSPLSSMDDLFDKDRTFVIPAASSSTEPTKPSSRSAGGGGGVLA